MNNKKYGKNVFCSDAVLEVFQKYKRSGNVRELSNVIERSVIMAEGDSIEITNLPESFFNIGNVVKLDKEDCIMIPFDIAMEEYEKKLITKAFKSYKSSRKVANALKISQSKANRLIRKYIESED